MDFKPEAGRPLRPSFIIIWAQTHFPEFNCAFRSLIGWISKRTNKRQLPLSMFLQFTREAKPGGLTDLPALEVV